MAKESHRKFAKVKCEVTDETRGYVFAKEGDGFADFSDTISIAQSTVAELAQF
jgi:hypothetical protein